jgi:hypothetical protein
VKIFVSSAIRGFEVYREAAARAAAVLRHEVKRAEDFPASPSTPQQACLAGVRWADAVLLLIGPRYGPRQPSGLSATHEEYREARERCPVLVFVQHGVDLEPAQQEFLREVQAWATGQLTASFSNPEELRDAVTAAVHDLDLTKAAGPVDEGEMLARARALLPEDRNALSPKLMLVVVGGPRQQVVRPAALEAPELEEALTQGALFGQLRILDRTVGTRAAIRRDALIIEQENASILLDQLGTVRIIVPAEHQRPRGDFGLVGVVIQEDVEELLQRLLGFVANTLDRIDTTRRRSDVVPIASVQGAMAWRTRAEHERSPNSYPVRTSQEPVVASLTPARRHRAALGQEAASIAEDLVVLLRRKMRV